MSIKSNARLHAVRMVEKMSCWHHNEKARAIRALRKFWSEWDRDNESVFTFLDDIGEVYGSYVARLAYEAA